MQIAQLSVFFCVPLLDCESTTTGYPGARRSAQAFNCDFLERVQWTMKREKIVSNASITEFAKAKDEMQSVVMEEVVGSGPTRGAKKAV